MNEFLVRVNKSVTVDYIYKTLLENLTIILEEGYNKDIVFDMNEVSFIEVDAIIPLTRAMITFAKCVQRKYGNEYRIRIIPSHEPAFLYLTHIGMWRIMEDWYFIDESENQYLDYIGRGYRFKKWNKVISFPNKEVFINSIKKNDDKKYESLENSPFDLDIFIRGEIENIILHNFGRYYEQPLNEIYDLYKSGYHTEVVEDLSELVTNAVFHGERESFVYFQTNVKLPHLTRKDKEVKGQFISVGDLGVGLGTSLKKKTNNVQEFFKWDGVEFIQLCDEILQKNNLSNNIFQSNVVLQSVKDIFEALYYSRKKEQDCYLRRGLYRLVYNVTYERGIVSISSGKVKIIFDSLNDIDSVFEDAIKEVLFLKERKNVTTHKRKIEGLQVDLEIRG